MAHIVTAQVTDQQAGNSYGIRDVRDLPGGYLVDDWKPFEESEVAELADALHPRVVRVLQGDKAELASLMHPQGFWRDIICLSWTFRTFYAKETIESAIPALLARADVTQVFPNETAAIVNLNNGTSLLRMEVPFTTANPAAKCLGIFKLGRLLNGDIKLFTAITQLIELECAPWKECVNVRAIPADLPEKTDILVIGGGHAGLSIGAYLSALNMDFAVIDKEKHVGDAWAKRYESATIHTTRLASGLPFRDLPDDYPEYVFTNQLASFYQEFARDLKLPIYVSTVAEKASFDKETKEWTVKTSRGTLVAKELVFAIGIGGRFPLKPEWTEVPNDFKGCQLHSAEYKNAIGWEDKKVVVIGTSSSGMDVALDCAKLGINTTIVQRSATRIYPPGHTERLLKSLYNDTRTVAESDQIACEDPVALQHPLGSLFLKKLAETTDPEYYAGLARAGFKAIHEGSLQNHDLLHSGKHYPDVGAGDAIIRGAIKVNSDAEVVRLDENGLVFSDGTHSDADVIVYCTGFKKDIRGVIAEIIGSEYNLSPIWGLNAEGEIRGAYGPNSGHDHLWTVGGGLVWMRHYSKYLAIQLAAKLAGCRPDPVYLDSARRDRGGLLVR